MKRKIWSVLLAAAMLFNLATPVLAADDGLTIPPAADPAPLEEQLPGEGNGAAGAAGLLSGSVDDALILSYDFNEADGGIIPDRSGNGNDAKIVGDVAVGGGLALFQGGYLRLPDGLMDGLEGMTVLGWVNRDVAALYERFFDFGKGKENYFSFQMRSGWGGEKPAAEVAVGGDVKRAFGGDFAAVDTWMHTAITLGDGMIRIYLDGVEVASQATDYRPADLEGSTQNYLGKSQYADPNFLGTMENVEVYGAVLDSDRIADRMNADNQMDHIGMIKLLEQTVSEIDLGGPEFTTDIVLPEAVGDITLSWASNHPELISNEGKLASSLAAGTYDVVMTVTAELNGVQLTKEFPIVVAVIDDAEAVQQAKAALGVVTLVDAERINLPTVGKYGTTITWTSSDPAVIAADGTVNRPAVGEGAVYVDLTATIRRGDAVETREFPQRMVMEEYAAYLLTYFGGEELKTNHEETYANVHFALSYDGLNWFPLNGNKHVVAATVKGVENPDLYGSDRPNECLARDPMVYREQDGSFRLLSSHSWYNPSIYVWDKGDLTSFSKDRILRVNMMENGNAWAPEVVYDPVKEKNLIVYTDPSMRDTTSCGWGTYTTDFTQEDVLPEEANIPLMDLSGKKFAYIDCSITQYNGSYYMSYKGENSYDSKIHLAKATEIGPNCFEEIGSPITDNLCEGPFIIKDNSKERWYLYYDYFTRGGVFGCSYTDDLDSDEWTHLSEDEYSLPDGVRHGNAIPITLGEAEKLIAAWGVGLETVKIPGTMFVAEGTPVSDLDLPVTLTGLRQDGKEIDLPVSWNTEAYLPQKGSYRLIGTLVLPDNVPNAEDFQTVAVTVKVGYTRADSLITKIDFEALEGLTALDASGNGNHLTMAQKPELDTGVRGKAMRFDGSAQYGLFPREMLTDVEDVTIAAWFKMDEIVELARLFDFGMNKYNYINFVPLHRNDQILVEGVTGSNLNNLKSVAVSSKDIISVGRWHHVALTIDANGVAVLYIDGKEIGRNENFGYHPADVAPGEQNYVGKSQWPDPLYKGLVDDFCIYGYAMGAEEVKELIAEGGADNTAIDDADTIAAYDFANAEDGVIADVSGHGNDAKINGEVAVNAGVAELTGGYISLPGFDFTGLDGVTVSAWMKREDPGKANSRLFDIGVKDIYFNLMFPSETSALVEIRPQSSDSSIRKVNAAVPGYGEWVHVAVTIGSGQNAIYVNGVKAGENTSCTYTPSMFTNTSNSSIGRSQYAGSPFYDPNFKGQIENFRIYNRVLTAEEIAAVKEENNQIGSGTVLATLKAALDGIAIENLDDVTADLALPAASGDVQFSWQSSNPAVIGHDGKFTPIEAGVEDVTLTVTASLDGVALTREFTASVYHHTPDEIINPKYLIASYNFDEADGGTVKDSSGHGRDGRIDGAVELVNGVAMFGGGYIQLPDSITDYDAMTVSGWLRVKTIQKNARFFDFGTGQNNYYSFQMLSNDGNADIEIKPQGSFNRVRAQSFPYESEWVHVVSTYSKGSNVLYFNGVEVGRNDSIQSSPSDMGKTTQNYIGKSQFADPNLRGLVENFKLYSKALTPEEVQLVMAEENQTADGETIQKLYDAVDGIDLGDLSDVTGDLALPAAINGVNFTWKSSKPDVIADNGDRNPDGKGRHEVVLTVTASEGGVTYSRDFIATVIYYTDEEIVNFDKDNLGVVTLVDVDKVYLPTTGKKGSTITWSSSNPAVIATDGAVNRPASGAGAAYVDLTATIQYGDATVTKEFPQRMVMEQYTAYLLTYFGGDELMTNDEPTYATVHFAYSYDGMHWVPLNDNKTIVAATLKGRDNPEYGQDCADVSLARDPVTYRQQDGKLRLLSSHSWNNHDIYVWDAGDLTSFSGERILSVNTDKGNAWAPEVVYDPVKEKYMIIFTDPNMGDSSCGYGTYTTDFTQADVDANKELGLTNIPLMDLSKQGRRYIDCSMHYYNGSYYMPVRYWAGDATHNGVTLAKSDSLEADSFTILPNYSGLEIDESVGDGNNEGPFLIKDFSRERWYLYYDYPDCGSGEEWGMFGLSYTDDLDSGIWHRVPFDEYAMPYGVRHGNATPITQGELDKLIERWGAPEELDVAQLTSPEVEAAAGTPFEQLDLPETVDVILLDGTTKAMPVTWSPENYKEEAGRYKIYGTFGSVEGVSNSKDLRPFVIVKTGGSTGSGLVVDVGFDTLDGKTAVDNSGYGNAMNFVDDLELVDGVNGKAVRFDGSQYANMSKELLMNLHDITISTWLKIDELQTWARAFDFGKGQANFINFIPRADDGNMRVEVRVYNENRSIRPGEPFPTGEWTHVAITMEPETQTGVLYLNGVEIGRSENFYYGPEHLGMSKLNQIGKSKFSDPIFQGAMDEFKMFDRALTAEQVLALYEGRPIDPEEPSDVDKTALKALIAAIDGKYDENRYTAASWKALTEALNAAKAVVADPNATAEELTGAAAKLANAVKGLKTKGSSSGSVSKVSDSDYWNGIIEKINGTEKGGTVNATLESGAMMPATVIDALKGKDVTLVVTVGGKDYAINGAGKLTGYTASAVYYTSDEIIAMADGKAPAAGDAAGNGNANPETGGEAGAAVASTIGGAAAPASEAPAVIEPEAPAEEAETGTNSDSLWVIAAALAAALVSGAGVAIAYRKHKG